MNSITSPPHFLLFPLLPSELRLNIYKQTLALNSTPRILKISYSPSLNRYISNTPPPILLSISSESRAYILQNYTNLSLGPSCPWQPRLSPQSHQYRYQTPGPTPGLPIPICYATDTLYISALFPLLTTHLHDFLWNLSTSSSRHHIRSLSIDLRVWNILCENGFIGLLARMRSLKEVCLVVEFGRCFEGELGFLEAPEWRMDLRWIAERAGEDLKEERERARGGVGKQSLFETEEDGTVHGVKVRCVILTRGGEQA
jgi:2EXR family